MGEVQRSNDARSPVPRAVACAVHGCVRSGPSAPADDMWLWCVNAAHSTPFRRIRRPWVCVGWIRSAHGRGEGIWRSDGLVEHTLGPESYDGNERTEAARRKEAGHFRGPFGGRSDHRSWSDQCCGVTVLLRRQKTRIPGSRSVGPGYAVDRRGSIRRSFARCRVLAWAQQGRSGPYDTIAKSMRGGEGTDATNRSYDLPAPPALRAQLLMLLDSHGEPTRAGPALCFRTSVCEFLN